MTDDRLRKRVRRIVERDIAAGAHSTSLLHADILALLDADPDTPTTDAPVDDGKDKLDANLSDRASDDSDALLVEQIARVLDEYLGAHLFKTGDWSRRNVNAMALALVVARPWQAEVDAARQDALAEGWEVGARQQAVAHFGNHAYPENPYRTARGETRQP